MTNKSNFKGWSGNTEITSLNSIISNLSGSTQSISNLSSPIIEGPVTIDESTKTGPSRTPSNGPVYKTGETQTQTFTSTRSLNIPLGIDLPFTAGTVDYSFPAGGGYQFDGFDGSVYDIKVDSNGKYLIGGGFGKYYNDGNNYSSPYLIRLNPDGTYDDTFDIRRDSDCYGGGFDGNVYSIEIQPDGKILVGGSFRTYDNGGNCWSYNRIIRLNPDATRDLTFNIGDGFNDDVYDIQLQPDGKILVGGYFTQYNNIDAYHIIRLNSNGSIDNSFLIGNSDVSFDEYVNVIRLQPNGKILVGGYFTTYGFNSQNYISRLNSDGTLDTTFQIGNGFDDEVITIALQSDGKIIVGGYFIYFDNNDLFNGKIIRLDTNGTIDTLFGYGLDNDVTAITIQPDGKILVGGNFNRFYIDNFNRVDVNYIIRFYSDCTFDYSFYYDRVVSSSVESIVILEDNNILIGGQFGDNDPEIYPLNYFGRLHNSISVYPYTYNVVSCARPLNDERITYVVGSMTPLEFESVHSFQSIQNPSVTVCGYIDYTYPSNLIGYVEVNSYRDCGDAYIDNYKLVTVEDCYFPYINVGMTLWVVDKKYEVGDILYIDMVYDGEGRTFSKFAAQIKTDENWNAPYPIWDYLPSIDYSPYSSCEEAINANGLIYGAGSCTEMESIYPLIHKAIDGPTVLLIPTGNNPVKILFNYYPYGPYEYISGGTPEIYSFVNLGDVSIETYEDLCSLGLTKVSPEGILNEDFLNTGFDGSLVYTMVEQPDGKILIGGNFNDYLEVTVGNFMRINPDGSLDETFYLGQFNSYIRAIAIQPDGKILVGGDFTNYDGYNAGRIIRLNYDGTIDSGFTFNSEFDGIVRTIAIQKDGKIVVGGGFSYYYDFYCPQIVRLNSDGTPDPTFVMGDGFDGDDVFTINIESTRNTPFYSENGPVTYTENIVVGGWFNWYNGTNVGGIVKLSPTGGVLPDFGGGFNINEGNRPRVNQILRQPDGKLVIIGGADGGQLLDYNETWIPQNIVRLVKNGNKYIIDNTFTTRDFDNTGGFNNGVLSATVLPNGKIMVGGSFNYYGDNEGLHLDLPYLVRLNSNGTLDETFTFNLNDSQVNKVLLLSSGRLLVGGRFNSPYDRLLELFIGEEYELHSFNTCDGETSNIFLPTGYESEYVSGALATVTEIPYEPISNIGLDLIYENDGGDDDSNFFIELPLDFDVNFLGVNYTSVNVGTNSYLTFGDGSDNYGIDPLPGDIPNGTGLPGIYLSTRNNDGTCLDSSLVTLYTGTTDGGNTTIVRFEGNHENSTDFPGETNLIYNFKFYKDQSNYFDIIIQQNEVFCNDDSTGGVSDGINPTWVSSFDSSSEKSYRIAVSDVKPIKANVNDKNTVCGTVGNVITTPQLGGGSIGGSMYFDGNLNTIVQVDNSGGQFGFGGIFDFTIEWFQYYEGGSSSRPFSIGVYGNPNEMIGMSFEGSVLLWVNDNPYNTTIVNDDLLNGWHHMAITRNFDGLNRTWRVFLDGVLKYEEINNNDTTNTYTLTLGNQLNNDGLFRGYITNFRVNNQTALYISNFNVPTSPLTCDANVILTMDASTEADLLIDSCGQQSITTTGVTWSNNSPFVNTLNFSLFTATDFTNYNSCTDCGQLLNTILYVRTGVSEYVTTRTMTKINIDNVLANGPIFTTGGVEAYEIINYYY